MDHQSPPSAPTPETLTREASSRRGRQLRWSRGAVIAAVAVALLLFAAAAALGAGDVALLSNFCASCHEIAPAVATWRVSPHAKVGCYACHEQPGPLTTRLARRVGRMSHELWVHVTDAPHGDAVGLNLQIEDAICEDCHDPARTPTSGDRVIIAHEEHAQRNQSCISCHLNSTHPDPHKDDSLVMMGQCFDCHGTIRQPEAAAECQACHPPAFDLEPQSHKPEVWQTAHGEVAKNDLPQCEMCHTGDLCKDCHGVVMPHPDFWTDGELGHSTLSKSDGAICVKCHAAKPEPCSTCHHSAHNPIRGPWATQHSIVVRAGGTAQCMDCHATDYCKECHEDRPPQAQ